jgi:hypothetical protein
VEFGRFDFSGYPTSRITSEAPSPGRNPKPLM